MFTMEIKSNSRGNTLPSSPKSNFFIIHKSGEKPGIIKQGFLERQASNIFSSRKQKWVVVQEGQMCCYDDEKGIKNTEKVIALANKSVSLVTTESSSTVPGKFYFQIAPAELNVDGKSSTSTRSEVFGTSSEDERKEWMVAINKAMYSKVGGAIFGGNLEDTLTFERSRNPDRIVPEIVEECVRFLKEYGMDVEGIFRLGGKLSLVRRLQEKFNRGERPTLVPNSPLLKDIPIDPSSHVGTMEMVDVHSTASLLKSYLLELPEPIIPEEFYIDIMTVVTREYELQDKFDSSIEKISSFVCKMPANSYNLLKYLCDFLKLVGDNESRNKMSYLNLGKVFCNTVLQPEVKEPALLIGTADNRAKAVMILMTFFKRIFKEEWKKDTGERPALSHQSSRLSKSWDDLFSELDTKSTSSLPADQPRVDSLSEESPSKIPVANSKSLELLASPRRDEECESPAIDFSRFDKTGRNWNSASTFSKFFDMFPRIGSSRKMSKEILSEKSSTDVHDMAWSSLSSSEQFHDFPVRNNSVPVMKRSSSVRDQASRDNLSRFYDNWGGNSKFHIPQEKLGQVTELDTDKDWHLNIDHLLEVKPKSLPVEALIEHFYWLQESLKAEHKKLNDQVKLHDTEVERLNREVKEQQQGREQAVTRVVELQAQLEKYFLKFGALD